MSLGKLFGLAVPYGEAGQPNDRFSECDETVFARGAFDDAGIAGAHIWLNIDHDRTLPIGLAGGPQPALALSYGDAGVYATIALDGLRDRDAALRLAAAADAGNIRGLSIEFGQPTTKSVSGLVGGVLRRTVYAAELSGVAVMITREPAFRGTWCWRTGPATDARFYRECHARRSEIFVERY